MEALQEIGKTQQLILTSSRLNDDADNTNKNLDCVKVPHISCSHKNAIPVLNVLFWPGNLGSENFYKGKKKEWVYRSNFET